MGVKFKIWAGASRCKSHWVMRQEQNFFRMMVWQWGGLAVGGVEVRGHGPCFGWVHHALWSTLDKREHPCHFDIPGGRTERMVCRSSPWWVVGVGLAKLLVGDAHPWWCQGVPLTAKTMGH